jgi:hypothetical protein
VVAASFTFVCDLDKTPERYEGGVIFLDAEERHKRRQTGVKLARKEVRRLSKRFGSDWQQQVLHDPDWLAKFCTNYPPLKISETTDHALEVAPARVPPQLETERAFCR